MDQAHYYLSVAAQVAEYDQDSPLPLEAAETIDQSLELRTDQPAPGPPAPAISVGPIVVLKLDTGT